MQTSQRAIWAQPMLIINNEPKTLHVLRCEPNGSYTYIQYVTAIRHKENDSDASKVIKDENEGLRCGQK